MLQRSLLLLALAAACAEPTAPPTVRDLEQQVDAVVVDLNWAVQDTWQAGGADVLVWAVIDTAVAPRLYRVARAGTGGDVAALTRARATFDRVVPQLQRALDAYWQAGGRDVLVSVQQAPPHYLRYPTRGAS